jgi:hypothetical protein
VISGISNITHSDIHQNIIFDISLPKPVFAKWQHHHLLETLNLVMATLFPLIVADFSRELPLLWSSLPS